MNTIPLGLACLQDRNKIIGGIHLVLMLPTLPGFDASIFAPAPANPTTRF
jgi:hypothetical protein